MSEFMDSLVERLPLHSALQKPSNQGRKVLDYTVGEFMDNYDATELLEGMFITSATGGYLDLWGRQYKVTRRPDETDDSYRERIIQESLGHLTTDYLESVYGLDLYSYSELYRPSTNKLVSDNPYNDNDGFMGKCDNDTITSLNKRFILGSNVHLVTGWTYLFVDSGTTGTVNSRWDFPSSINAESTINGLTFTYSPQSYQNANIYLKSSASSRDWSDGIVIDFDIVDATGIRFMVQSGASVSILLNPSHFRVVFENNKASCYVDGKYVAGVTNLPIMNIRFYLTSSGGSITIKNFTVQELEQ